MGFWDNILAVDDYSLPYYEHIPFAKELYACFPNLVFYGNSGANNHDDGRDAPDVPEGVILVDQTRGWNYSAVMVDAMTRFPDYEGYLFLMDDSLPLPWNMERYDRNRVWYTGMPKNGRNLGMWPYHPHAFNAFVEADTTPPNKPWPHWSRPDHGLCQYLKAWEEIPQQYQERLQAETNGMKKPAIADVADCFYVPQRLREDFLAVAKPMAKHKVWLEIAIPSTLLAIEGRGQYEAMNAVIMWEGPFPNWEQHIVPSMTEWLHPVKFSSKENRDAATALFLAHADPLS